MLLLDYACAQGNSGCGRNVCTGHRFLVVLHLPQTNISAEHGDNWETSLLQVNPGPSTQHEPGVGASTETPGPSQASTHLENNDFKYCMNETDFRMSDIKEEQVELVLEKQQQETDLVSPDLVKSEHNQPETYVSYEMQPISSDCSADQNETNDSEAEHDNEIKTKEKNVHGQKGHGNEKGQKGSAKSQKDRSFCHMCGKGFQYIGSLMKHIKTHESTKDCSVCGFTFQSTKVLISHLQNCHKKSCFCNICGKTYASKRCLRKHQKVHTDVKEIACQECGKTFHRKEHLVLHVRTHSGERPYHCDICGKAFSQSQNLTIHKRSHSGEKPYHCSQCGKLFSSSNQLKTHMRYHTGEKPYGCDICGKHFYGSGQMTRHRTTHTGERPYCCHICGMRYMFAPNLKGHMKTHETTAS